jgi:hypothetical protein
MASQFSRVCQFGIGYWAGSRLPGTSAYASATERRGSTGVARYTARILCLGLGTEVREAIERQLTADHLALAKVKALRAAGDVPLAARIICLRTALRSPSAGLRASLQSGRRALVSVEPEGVTARLGRDEIRKQRFWPTDCGGAPQLAQPVRTSARPPAMHAKINAWTRFSPPGHRRILGKTSPAFRDGGPGNHD